MMLRGALSGGPWPTVRSRAEMLRFLTVLRADEHTPLFWVTFDDKYVRKDLSLTSNCSFAEIENRLYDLNSHGAGVFVCVGRIGGGERLRRNVLQIETVVLDLDNSPLPRSFRGLGLPHLVVQTSPGRWHCYWKTDSIPLDAFSIIQRKLADAFGGDSSVSRPEQIVRVPGFLHNKAEPRQATIVHDRVHQPPRRFVELARALKDVDLSRRDPGRSAIPWIRDRASGSVIDQRFPAHAVWEEALRFKTTQPAEIAIRAWSRCTAEADIAALGSHCTAHRMREIADVAVSALGAGSELCRRG